jgi:4-amino-4-deoxy-L-arabinose transferase-like glycosyltransferase
MNVLKKYPFEFLFFLSLFFFVLLKLNDLLLPFQWDELGVYAPGAFSMKDSGHIGLLPSCLTPTLSRGHPLLFTFCSAVVFNIFGESHIVGHAFSMTITIVTLIVFFLFAQEVFNAKTAFFSSILLMVHPNFFMSSVMILPEMMLTLFSVLSIWGIVSKRWWLYAIAASLAMMTKESAIVIPLIALLIILFDAFKLRDYFSVSRLRVFLPGIVPLLVFGLFMVIQKIQNGWFLFPEHIGYLHLSWGTNYPIGKRILTEMLFNFGKWLTGITFLAGVLLCFFRKPLGIQLNARVLWIFAGLCFFIFLFADVNTYLTRYILYSAPFVILGGVHTFFIIIDRIVPGFKFAGMVLLAGLSLYATSDGHAKMYEYPYGEMSYKFALNVVQDAVTWTEQQPWKNDTIETNFPLTGALWDKRNGYLRGETIPLLTDFGKKTRYGLFYFEYDTKNIPNSKNYKYTILKMWSDHYANVAWVEYHYDSADFVKH